MYNDNRKKKNERNGPGFLFYVNGGNADVKER